MFGLERDSALTQGSCTTPAPCRAAQAGCCILKGNYAFSFVSGCFTSQGNPIRVSFVTC